MVQPGSPTATSERQLATIRRLADVCEALAALPSYEAMLQHAPDLIAPALADTCAIYVGDGDGPGLFAVHRQANAKRELGGDHMGLVTQVYRQARPLALPLATPELGPCLLIPLIACGRSVGVLLLAQHTLVRTLSAADLPLFRGLALSLACAAASIAEIKAHAKAEEALRASEAFYHSLIEDQEDLVVRLLPDGTRTFVNAAYCRHLGRTREELLGTNVYEHIHPDDVEQVRQRAAIYASGGNPQIGLSRGVRPDGSACWYEWTGRGICDSQGNLIEIQSVGRDVTERQRAALERHTLERKMLEAQKLESLGVLAGGIAHDFNNILTAILGHAELTLLDLPPHMELRTNVQMIIEGTQRAADLTRQILAYSGKGRAIIQQVIWSDLIDAMEDLLRTAVQQNVRLTLLRGTNLPPVEADPSQLRQVLLNLVVNASESFNAVEGGDIVVATGVAELGRAELDELAFGGDLPPGSYVYAMVSDDGCGMEAATLARIFDPFFSTKFIGRGLGLAAVQGIVRSHRGTLRVTSTPGTGTTAMIWLPVAAGARAKAASESLPGKFPLAAS